MSDAAATQAWLYEHHEFGSAVYLTRWDSEIGGTSDDFIGWTETALTRAKLAPADELHETQGDMICQECGCKNPVWFADNALWNLVMGGPDAKGDPGGILCANCFIDKSGQTLRVSAPADGAAVERVAHRMWREDAVRAAPTVTKLRTPKAFAEETDELRERWMGLARAALAAMREG